VRGANSGMAISPAWLPSRVKPTSPPVPQTSVPSQSDGPASTTPEKSRPGTRGNKVPSICPATFLTSLGFTDAEWTRTIAQPTAPRPWVRQVHQGKLGRRIAESPKLQCAHGQIASHSLPQDFSACAV
jgi:hypothetical protein